MVRDNYFLRTWERFRDYWNKVPLRALKNQAVNKATGVFTIKQAENH